MKASQYGGYDEWWAAVGENHTEQEKEYVDNLKELIDIGKEEGKKGEFSISQRRCLVSFVLTLNCSPWLGCFLKLYKLPFGATDRSFQCRTLVIEPPTKDDAKDSKDDSDSSDESSTTLSSKPGSRAFLSFSLPITTAEPRPEEKKYVRGMTVTVERVEEEDEGKTIVWTCASLSTPGGSIPVKLGESKM